mmetsp:Transcript_12299/g.35248  ORF Transcript_12299/g.35248 Transcript_12299/m.35248 type:complete len:86 (+) Transcript_12299:1363-1620(+)
MYSPVFMSLRLQMPFVPGAPAELRCKLMLSSKKKTQHGSLRQLATTSAGTAGINFALPFVHFSFFHAAKHDVVTNKSLHLLHTEK